MKWSIFLHFYQPPNQRQEILEKIVNESYRPLIKGFLANPKTRLTLNINGCLTELLAQNGFTDVIEGLKRLAENGQLEFTGSGKYHPFLPILPKEEIIRQIKLNDETNRQYFGRVWQPKGFFPPEMGYDPRVAEAVSSLGFDWIILDEIAFNGKIDTVDFSKIFKVSGLPLKVVFRERRASNLIMGAQVWTVDSVFEALSSELTKDRYLITAMDAETFGHHRPGLENLLFNLFASNKFQFVTVSEIREKFPDGGEIEPVSSCWASSEEEIEKGESFYLYSSKKNKLHLLLKKLLDLAIEVVKEKGRAEVARQRFSAESEAIRRWRDRDSSKIGQAPRASARFLLDRAESCNAFWWANPDAWWSIEEIEMGAFNLWQVVEKSKTASSQDKEASHKLYQEIVFLAFTWQREGIIHKLHAEKQAWIKIPFKKRAKPGEYEAMIEILNKELQKAVSRQEFEQAIRWRDSIYKLEHGLDIYNLVHVVDQLRAEGRLGEYAKLTEKYKKKYRRIAPGQPE